MRRESPSHNRFEEPAPAGRPPAAPLRGGCTGCPKSRRWWGGHVARREICAAAVPTAVMFREAHPNDLLGLPPVKRSRRSIPRRWPTTLSLVTTSRPELLQGVPVGSKRGAGGAGRWGASGSRDKHGRSGALMVVPGGRLGYNVLGWGDALAPLQPPRCSFQGAGRCHLHSHRRILSPSGASQN